VLRAQKQLFTASSNIVFCNVSALVGMDAELDELSVDDVRQIEDEIVSQWDAVSADQLHEMHKRVNETLRPFGCETSLLVIRRANSLALYFLCMTLSALLRLRDHWTTGQLRDVVQSLFTLMSQATRQVRVKRLTWPTTDFERCREFLSSVQGRPKQNRK